MTVIAFPRQPIRAVEHDDTLRADCERLMRRLVREKRTSEQDMRALADFLDYVILQSERDQ